jgi:hypothetical protein
VKGAMSVLATFQNIKGDNFKEAMVAAADLSTIMGNDLNAAVMALGKALNDPAEGLAALSRLGIRFTEDQKAMIERMVATGDAASAQDAILKALADRMGGSAAAAADTYAGKIAQLKNNMGDLAETVGGLVAPKLAELAGSMNGLLSGDVTSGTAADDVQKDIAKRGEGEIRAMGIEATRKRMAEIGANRQSLIGELQKTSDEIDGLWMKSAINPRSGELNIQYEQTQATIKILNDEYAGLIANLRRLKQLEEGGAKSPIADMLEGGVGTAADSLKKGVSSITDIIGQAAGEGGSALDGFQAKILGIGIEAEKMIRDNEFATKAAKAAGASPAFSKAEMAPAVEFLAKGSDAAFRAEREARGGDGLKDIAKEQLAVQQAMLDAIKTPLGQVVEAIIPKA